MPFRGRAKAAVSLKTDLIRCWKVGIEGCLLDSFRVWRVKNFQLLFFFHNIITDGWAEGKLSLSGDLSFLQRSQARKPRNPHQMSSRKKKKKKKK